MIKRWMLKNPLLACCRRAPVDESRVSSNVALMNTRFLSLIVVVSWRSLEGQGWRAFWLGSVFFPSWWHSLLNVVVLEICMWSMLIHFWGRQDKCSLLQERQPFYPAKTWINFFLLVPKLLVLIKLTKKAAIEKVLDTSLMTKLYFSLF